MNAYEGLPPQNWDDVISKLHGNVLQSRVWAQFQQNLRQQVIYSSGEGWAWCAAVRKARAGIKYLYVPYGPIVNDKESLEQAMTSLEQAGKQAKVDFVRVQPVGAVNESDMVIFKTQIIGEVNPVHTNVLDLTQTEEQLRSGLESGHRNRVNGAERRGISIHKPEGDSISEFLRMAHDTERHNKIKLYSDHYFKTMYQTLRASNNAQLYVAEAGSEAVAAAIVFDWDKTRYYAYAAADQAKNRKIGAAVVLVWQTILDAKAIGKTEYDFWGVSPANDASHKWAGLSAFKRGFGGIDKTYLSGYDVILKPTKYKLYQLASKMVRP